MTLKTILVCLTTSEHAETLMKVAVPLARKHGAHLIGLHTVEALVVYPGIAMHIPEPAFEAFNSSQDETSYAIEAIFNKHTKAEDFPSEYRLVRAEAMSANERMVESARAADLVIMAHEDKVVDRVDQKNAQTEVIRQSGRPVVVVPLDYDGPEIGNNVLLGWSNTREATRAAHDMVDMLASGADVTILRVGASAMDELQDPVGIDLAELLSRHGLKTTLEYRGYAGKGIAEVMNTVALEKGADMIVTGAFGHSKAYDFVIGAATYSLLRDAKLPVLFSK